MEFDRFQVNSDLPFQPWGAYRFDGLASFLSGRPFLFLGQSPTSISTRYWRTTTAAAYAQIDGKPSRRINVTAGIRYEMNSTPREKRGLEGTLVDPYKSTQLLIGKPTFENPSLWNIGPRLGLSLDLSKVTVRGGVAVLYDFVFFDVLRQSVTLPPVYVVASIANPAFPNAFSTSEPVAGGLQGIFQPERNLKNPYAIQVNSFIDIRFSRDVALSAGFVGNRGVNLIRTGDVNMAVPEIREGRLFTTPNRPNRAFSTIDLRTSDGDSWHAAGQLRVKGKVSERATAMASYSYGRTIDTGSGATRSAFISQTEVLRIPGGNKIDRGLASFHTRHSLSALFVANLGRASSKGLRCLLLSGWEASGVGSFSSGHPFDIVIQTDWANRQSASTPIRRPDLRPGVSMTDIVRGGADSYFVADSFLLPPRGTIGNFGRNVLIGPSVATVDIALGKHWMLPHTSDRSSIELRLEVFNGLNHANFGQPDSIVFAGRAVGEIPLSSAGRIRSTSTPSRRFQLTARYVF